MLTWNDVLLIGQYPSGNLYFYDGNEIKPFVPAIPFKKYKSEVGREAQTLAIYNGKLFVGVWPWGETWIFDEDQQKWQKGPRLFENPQSPSGEEAFLEPYHKEIFELNLKNKVHDNFWGQRINGMVVFNDSLFASTQNKYGQPYIPEIHGKILSKKEALQYGKVHKLTGSPQTSCQINMKPITTLEFRSERSRLLIIQDGVLLCQTPIKSILSRYLGQTKLILGEGIYGKFPGVITSLYQE